MGKLKIMVVEDEAIIAMHLSEILEDLGYEPLDPVASFEEAIHSISAQQVDLLLLDVMLSGDKNGIDIASYVRQQALKLPIIFITSHADRKTVEAAKKTKPNGYLVKPFTAEDVYTAIEMALLNFGPQIGSQQEDASKSSDEAGLFIKEDHVFIKILFQDIYWIESAKNYLIIHTINSQHKIRATFNEFVPQLPTAYFFRIHKSHIVNLRKVESSNSEVLVVNGKILPISRNKRKELSARLST